MPSVKPICITTERLLLRPWRTGDREPFAALNADPRVMEHFPKLMTREESDAAADRIAAHFEQHGFGWWAVEVPGVTGFAGFVGIQWSRIETHFTPCIELGWRLAAEHWGHGFATEAAQAAAAYGFESLRLPEIVSYTVPMNVRSRRVMEKLGMTHDPAEVFDHPSLPEAHRLRQHVLYRLWPDRSE